jgi:hypothetical protein
MANVWAHYESGGLLATCMQFIGVYFIFVINRFVCGSA